MKKIFLIIGTLAILSSLFLVSSSVLAQGTGAGITITALNVPEIITKVGVWLYRVILATSLIFFLMAGFLYLTAKPENIKKANNHLVYGVVGVSISILAFSITELVIFFISP